MTSRYDPEVREKIEEGFRKVFEALRERDFEKAASLAPDGYKLCGYQEFSEPFKHEQYGFGWAGQFEITEVSPGLYPVYVREYNYHDAKESFTNQVKDFQGLWFWYTGTVISSSDIYFEKPYQHTTGSSPYSHSVAKDIIEGKSKVQLLPPFEAKTISFEYEGESLVTYKIIDTAIPSLTKDNPIYLRTDPRMPSLHEQIQSSAAKTKIDSPSFPKNKANDLDL